MTTRERRRRPRVDFGITAFFETDEQDSREFKCENLSMSGIFLQTDKPLPVGTLGRLLLVLRCGEDRIKIHAECRVVRIVADACDRPRGMGLEYTNLDSDSSIALYNVVRYQGGIEEHDHENK